MVNALALRGDEGRDKLRKAAGRSKYPQYPQVSEWGNPSWWRHDIPCKRKANPENWNILVPGGKENNLVIPLVVAIERGIAQTNIVLAILGLKDRWQYYKYKMEYFWKVKP